VLEASAIARPGDPDVALQGGTLGSDNSTMRSDLGRDTPAATDVALVRAGRERSAAGLPSLERRIAATSALGVVLAALAIWAAAPPHAVPFALAALLVAGYAAASRVRFEVGAGSAAPTQLAFAPMMVLLPPALLVPAAIAGYLLGSERPRSGGGRQWWEAVLIQVGGCWYAVGAAVVMTVSGVQHPSLSAAGWYATAFAIQCVCDLVASVLQERLVLGAPIRELLAAMTPCWVTDLLITPVTVCLAAAAPPLAVVSALPLLYVFRLSSRERSARYDQVMALNAAYRGTALLLGDVVEADHEYTAAHSRDVVELSLAVADRLGLGAAERTHVEFAALLHDVGKIKVPKRILDKPGPLTADERRVIDQHTIWGEEMLVGVGGLLANVGHIVRSCHERWDGGGYPDGLAGSAIPIAARIVCACDAFSAMTTTRAYRPAGDVADALAELWAGSGTHFDPEVVAILVTVVQDSLGRHIGVRRRVA
jgi:HD-GYP domain-containing protein (c-di-GMP phosphodiesterase class II)